MEKWLAHIISDGTLVDNQVYQFNSGVCHNHRFGKITIAETGRRTHHDHYNDEVFRKLFHKQAHLNDIQKKAEVILFKDAEYEHNTDAPYYNLSGLSYHNFTLQTGNLIGFIKLDEYCIRIGSRFGDDFLKYLIADTHGFLEIKNMGAYAHENSFDWILYYLWQIKLKKAFRLGIPKTYQSREDISNKPKGQIDTLHYELFGHLGKYKSKFREQSYLSDSNILIALTFKHEKLFKHCHSEMNGIRNAFITATEGKKLQRKQLISVKHFSNPYFKDYNEVIDLSKRILFSEGLSIASDSESSAFLFDVSMLFEYFIRKLLTRNGFVLRSKFSERLKIPTGVEAYRRKLEPDIVIEHENNLSIFDVKYKNFDNVRQGVEREDLFQIHTYLGQYGNSNPIKACGFIYPKKGKENNVIKQNMKIMGKDVDFYVFLLAVPGIEEQNFISKFRDNCNDFVSQFTRELTTNN
jgi:5-methylcytosine-specific restriction enzyme subunit McrC